MAVPPSKLAALVCVPVLILFGWLMVQRLVSCPKGAEADFAQEWTSARSYWTGRPIYLPLDESFPVHFGREATTKLRVNAHPPAAVLIALPLGQLSYRAAWLAWNLISLALLGGTLWLLARGDNGREEWWTALILATLLFASNPLAQQVIEGQMNLLLLALLTGAWAAERNGRPGLAGACVGTAAAIKLFPALLIVHFLGRKQWSAALTCAGAFLSLNLMAAGVLGSDVFSIYVHDVMPNFAEYKANLANASLTGLWSKIFVGVPGLSTPVVSAPQAMPFVTLATGLAIVAVCAFKSYRARDFASAELAFAACVMGMLLASPITWGHAFLLLALPLVIVWRNDQRPLIRGLVAGCAVAALLVRPGWIWNACVPGFEAYTLGLAPGDFQVSPAYTLTSLSYMTWAVGLLFVTTLAARPVSTPQLEPRS